ncbi:hypothetical protein BQ8420_11940 [Nocardiopsis sp. JB363]|nr:hypothetical protein BQ8420_11940 [Nocardiopsis sp. JB363]
MWGDVKTVRRTRLGGEEPRTQKFFEVRVRWIAYQWARSTRFGRLAPNGKIISVYPRT